MGAGGRWIFHAMFAAGLLLVVVGICVVLFKGVELDYTTYFIQVPHYVFETTMPGNYTETRVYSMEIASVKQATVQPLSVVYSVSLPWQNCTGGRFLGVAFVARPDPLYSGVPVLILEAQGCRYPGCELLVSSDLIATALSEKVGDRFMGKADYRLHKSILEYRHLNLSLTPVGLVVEEFYAGTEIACTYSYEVRTPVLVVKHVEYKQHFITVPTSVDTTWPRAGVALSLAGFVLIAFALYLRTPSKVELSA